MRLVLALAAASALAAPLPVLEQQRSDPAPPRLYGPDERLSRRQRKRARIAERKKLKAGIPGSKLARKAAGGKL